MSVRASSSPLQRRKDGISARFLNYAIIFSIISGCHGFGASVGISYLDSTPLNFNLGVTNLAVVDKERIPAQPMLWENLASGSERKSCSPH